MKYLGFMAHLSEDEFDYLEEVLQEYNIGSYLIGFENEPYDHFHFLVEMELNDYHNFTQRVFVKKYKLRGKAKDGNCRQYGKIKDIQDIDKLKSYTIKDNNYRSNLSEADVLRIFEQSHKKESLKLLKDKMFQFVEDIFDTKDLTFDQLNKNGNNACYKPHITDSAKHAIIEFMLQNDVQITTSKLKTFYNYWISKTEIYLHSDRITLLRQFNNFI